MICFKCSMFNPKLSSSHSHIIGSIPNCTAGVTVVTQDTAGTIILLFLNLPDNNKLYKAAKFADEPELTNTEYFFPNHSDHSFSNLTFKSPLVNLGFVSNQDINFLMSSLSIVSLTKSILFIIFLH